MNRQVLIAGAKGMVGSAICRACVEQDIDHVGLTREQVDFTDAEATLQIVSDLKPESMVIAAALVGGIKANDDYPASFISQNLSIQQNLITAAHSNGVKRLIFLGSSCIYPKMSPQPIQESALLTGPLEPTNEAYAIAKIAGIKACEAYNKQYNTDYRSLMPTNLYGIGDNFHPENSHVIPGLMRRIHEAKLNDDAEVAIWGSGTPRREFLCVDDVAQATLHVLNIEKSKFWNAIPARESHINVGTGIDISIRDLATMICKVVGYEGKLVFDASKPDGTPRKLLDVSRLTSLGWRYTIELEAGLAQTHDWFLANHTAVRA